MHIALRERLEELRDHLDGNAPGPRGTDLRSHCLAFCAAVVEHHTAEDDGAFPVLAREHPELRSVLDELDRDHRIVSDALTALADLFDRLGEDPASLRMARTELDSVAALLETHFTYEERKIAGALSTLTGRLDPADAGRVTRATTVPSA